MVRVAYTFEKICSVCICWHQSTTAFRTLFVISCLLITYQNDNVQLFVCAFNWLMVLFLLCFEPSQQHTSHKSLINKKKKCGLLSCGNSLEIYENVKCLHQVMSGSFSSHAFLSIFVIWCAAILAPDYLSGQLPCSKAKGHLWFYSMVERKTCSSSVHVVAATS